MARKKKVTKRTARKLNASERSKRLFDMREYHERPVITPDGPTQMQAVALSRQHNSTQLFSRLPSAAVATIIQYDRENQLYPMNGSLGWIRLTHVCHYWRSVAFREPALWADIPIHGRRFAQTREWLVRSQKAIIRVDTIDNRRADLGVNDPVLTKLCKVSAYNLVIGQLYRVQSLHIILPEETMARIQWGNYVAGVLERLVIEIIGVSTAEVTELPSITDPPPLLNAPIPAMLPNLTVLHLINVRNQIWGHNIFPASLKELSVSYARTFEPPLFSLQDLLNDLGKLSSLEVVLLENSLNFYVITEDPAVTRMISFPELCDIFLIADARRLAFLLDRLIIPTFARVKVLCSSVYRRDLNAPKDILSLSTAISGFTSRMQPNSDSPTKPFNTCYVRFSDTPDEANDTGDCIMLWRTMPSFDEIVQCQGFSADMRVGLPYGVDAATRNLFLQQIGHPLADVTILYLDGPSMQDLRSHDSVSRLYGALRRSFPGVQAVHISSRGVPGNPAEVFSLCVMGMSDVAEVHLRGLKFGVKNFTPFLAGAGWAGLGDAAVYMIRQREVKARHAVGVNGPVSFSLHITECYDVRQADVDLLRHATSGAALVIWDGVSVMFPQSDV